MSDAPARLDLGAELTIGTAARVRGTLAPLLEAAGDVSFAASALERVDTAGLQLLCAFAGALRQRGRALRPDAPSPALDAAASALGLTEALWPERTG